MGENVDKGKGRVKEAAGDLTGDKDLKREGKVDRAAGEVKERSAVRRKVKETVSRKRS